MAKSQITFGVSEFSTTQPLPTAEVIIGCGMDFIEPGLAKIATMPEANFLAAVHRLRASGIGVQSVNWFLPASLKVTGPEVDVATSQEFLELALARAAQLGAKAVVFGSPGSRSVPDGFSADVARGQMIDFCHLCSDVIRANEWDLRIAIEHVNRSETNFINTFAQALSIAREVDRREIGLAADFYHFEMEKEPMNVIAEAADLICAVQIANPVGRCFPQAAVEIPRLDSFFQQLSDIGYEGGVSVEANVQDLRAECRSAVLHLRGY